MFYISIFIGKISYFIIKYILKKETTTRPGIHALKIKKDFIKYFKFDYEKVIFITGTNGKSSSTNLINHILKKDKKLVTSNLEGANMLNGIATSLIKDCTFSGKLKSEYLIFEIDERFLNIIYNYLPAKIICFTNLQKDQVQRNGDPSYVYDKIKNFLILHSNITIFLNNDDPRSKSLEQYAEKVIYYGVDKNNLSFDKKNFFDITLPCPICSHSINFDYYNIDNIGNFHCSSCDLESNKNIDYLITDVNYDNKTIKCNNSIYNINYTIAFFLYNYALAIAISHYLNISDEIINNAFESFENIKGRIESLKYKNKEIKYIRIKQENPETLQHAIDYVKSDYKDKIILLGLEEIKDFRPYYTNTFYAYDCNFNNFKDASIKKIICFSEAVSYDTANCLLYSGINPNKISIIASDSNNLLFRKLDKFDTNNVYLITWIKKYQQFKKDIKETI